MISHEMTDTPAPAEPYVCPHCEETHAHEHVDSRAVVLAHRRRLAVVSAARIVLVLLAVVGVLLWLPATAGLALIASGVLAWALATAAGLLVASLDLARQGGQGQAAGAGSRRLVTVSVLTGAALTPVAALLVALAGRALVDGTGPGAAAMVATAAGTGWLTASAAADVVRALRLRSLLGAESRAGEVARAAAVRTRDRADEWTQLATVVVTAAVVALWVGLCHQLPAVVVVLVPLHVALVALSRRLVSDRTRTR